jgi:hypothetical protein
LRFPKLRLPDPFGELFEEMTNSGHLLVGGSQAQFLLVFDTLP